jgi:hypothetical protein
MQPQPRSLRNNTTFQGRSLSPRNTAHRSAILLEYHNGECRSGGNDSRGLRMRGRVDLHDAASKDLPNQAWISPFRDQARSCNEKTNGRFRFLSYQLAIVFAIDDSIPFQQSAYLSLARDSGFDFGTWHHLGTWQFQNQDFLLAVFSAIHAPQETIPGPSLHPAERVPPSDLRSPQPTGK